ncbi:DUF885 domain-containing protein [Candidatus Aminicenantes bacterium AC-335-A11]|jgi:uncharacterized protein (DUF885 family)|nr:DUF885 domain-containing protein [SCandidatus Aminicenantes bacterium Aminicenantia_JdfR_composite]MCP2596773.1 DUF885 domain-containing protein [Candidatus Aminicenantes bacterium AC-335-G13]MCP2605559.1 DUF885 domain-containing protein [Candidatus Aminicenantes bacterium AC-335-O07]MCP2617903.1 DUF885 domain-containing protein [Candidatus Aminicenantes bacterium AC-335-A11]
MKKKIGLFIIFSFIILLIFQGFSQSNKEDQKFDEWVAKFLDKLWQYKPTSATFAGYHKYDNKLEDLSEGRIKKRIRELDEFSKELASKIDKFKLSKDKAIDYEIIVDAIDYEKLQYDYLKPWENNPLLYNRIIGGSINSLMSRDFAPLEERVKNAIARMEKIPDLIKQAKKNLKNPPQIFTETAITQNQGNINYFKNTLPKLAEGVSQATKARLQAQIDKVVAALEDYDKFLREELLPRSTGEFRLGTALFQRKARYTLQSTIPLEHIVARAQAAYKNVRREMAIAALPLFRMMYPEVKEEELARLTDEQKRNKIVGDVLKVISKEHPTKEGFFDYVKKTVEEIRNFIIEKDIIDLPKPDRLYLRLTPEYARGIAVAGLEPPGPYEPEGKYYYQVSPIPEDWDYEQVESFLREYNNYMIKILTIHEALPGHYVQLYYSNKYPSIVRNVFPSGPTIEGWAVFTERIMIESGYGNWDCKLRLIQLKFYLRAVVNCLLDFNVHLGGMTKDQAIKLMTRGAFQELAEAEGKWRRACLTSTQLSTYFVGSEEISEIQKEYKKIKGKNYNQKEFLQKLISYGSIPIRHLRELILHEQ